MKWNAKVAVAAVFAASLSACTSIGRLEPAGTGVAAGGTVTRGFLEPYRVELNLDGKTFRGEWRSGPPRRDQLAGTPYPHRWHVRQVQSLLVADDGSQARCHWEVHGVAGKGKCTVGEREYQLLLE